MNMYWSGVLVVLFMVLLMSCCTYEKEPTEWEQFSGGIASVDGSGLVCARKYELYRKPTGLARFPDGGQAKILKNELALYIYSYSDEKVERVGLVEGRAGNPPTIHASWKGDQLVYWLYSSYNQNKVPPVSWSHNRGIFIVNTRTLEQRQLLEYGEMPELSPSGTKVAFLKQKAEDFHDLWMVNVDGTQAQCLKEITDFKVNWIEWPEPEVIYLYSSLSDKQVYRLNISSGELTEAEREYASFPPQIRRKEVRRLFEEAHMSEKPE